MLMKPLPHQEIGAKWLAERRRAFLFWAPRTGKTGTAIIAADMRFARRILVLTTASGRGVWRKAFCDWSNMPRVVRVFGVDAPGECDVLIVSYDMATRAIGERGFDLILLDEDQKVVNPETKRAQAVYGSLVQPGDVVWNLTGSPCPLHIGNMWTRVAASFPERLEADARRGWPDVKSFEAFRNRYCIVRRKKLSPWTSIDVVVGSCNEQELYERLEGTFQRLSQAEIGISDPFYDTLPLIVTEAQRREADGNADRKQVLAAIASGRTRDLEMSLARLRQVTGVIKANAVVSAAKDFLEKGDDKLVIAFWHREVGDILARELNAFGVLRLDGSTPPKTRETLEALFRGENRRVFLAQITAASEAISLAPANDLWFCEMSFSPKDMDQMSKRVTNIEKKTPCFVKVCCVAGSLDEAMTEGLMRKWAGIRKVIR